MEPQKAQKAQKGFVRFVSFVVSLPSSKRKLLYGQELDSYANDSSRLPSITVR